VVFAHADDGPLAAALIHRHPPGCHWLGRQGANPWDKQPPALDGHQSWGGVEMDGHGAVG
jgi:hypothetical protein